jgi:hypothetical protein
MLIKIIYFKVIIYHRAVEIFWTETDKQLLICGDFLTMETA